MSKVNASWNRNDIQDLSSINQEQEDKIKRGINQAFDKWTYNQIIDESYRNYLIEDGKILPNMSKEKMAEMGYRLTQEEFIAKIKIDPKFSERWGLKIEERELSLEERVKLCGYKTEIVSKTIERYGEEKHKENCDKHNVPTKLIYVEYNGEKIEVYE